MNFDKSNTPLIQNNFYHIYNRGNVNQDIFFNPNNYDYFLRKLFAYLNQFVNFYSYCLLPNHFHLLIKVMREEIIFNSKPLKISRAFSNFFNSYTKSINVQNNRFGNMFQRPFKRIPILKETYLMRAVCYIHRNPVHHLLTKDFESYRWSSYNRIIDNKNSNLQKNEVLEWFGGADNYKTLHKQILIDYKDAFVIE